MTKTVAPDAKPATAVQVPASARERKPVNTQEAVARLSAVIAPPGLDDSTKPAKKAQVSEPKPQVKEQKAKVAPAKGGDPLALVDEENDPLNPDNEGDNSDVLGSPDAENGAVDENQTDVDADATETENEPEVMHSIVIDGKEVKISHEELVKGYQRQADYTRKTQALAKDRKDLDAVKEQVKDLPTVQKTYQENAERFSKNAQLVMVALEQRFMPQPPDAALAESNPGAYIRQKEQFQEAMQFRAGLQHELTTLETRQKQEQEKLVNDGRKKLFETYPEMKDAAARQKLKAYANAHGFTDEQIKAEASPVLFIWADKARKYDEIMEAQKKLSPDKSLPKVSKQTKAVEGHKAVQARQRTGIIDQHKNKKSVDSAARAIAGLGIV